MRENKPKNRILLIAALIAFFIGVVLLGLFRYANLEKGPPKIQVIPTSYDFGDIPFEPVQTEFVVTNIGEGILQIKKVTTSCGCTKATIESERLVSGESTILYVTFDPNLMHGGASPGEVYRIVYIKSNDPEEPEVEIEIMANLIQSKK